MAILFALLSIVIKKIVANGCLFQFIDMSFNLMLYLSLVMLVYIFVGQMIKLLFTNMIKVCSTYLLINNRHCTFGF